MTTIKQDVEAWVYLKVCNHHLFGIGNCFCGDWFPSARWFKLKEKISENKERCQ